jgi:hypothetical protein
VTFPDGAEAVLRDRVVAEVLDASATLARRISGGR